MIKHTDWDAGTEHNQQYLLPTRVKEISVSHDGGRISISIDGVQVYYSCVGTRDCSIVLDNDPLTP